MKEGVAVVAYDCKSLRVLSGCSVVGGYRFTGVSRKEEVVRMQNSDELSANLPLSGAALSAGLKRDASLDLALITVGKQRASALEITRDELKGSCDGATHLVRGTYVGAFALSQGTLGEVRAAAQIFGLGSAGSSSANKSSESKDGDLAECRRANPQADATTAGCAAITRLELLPFVASKKAAAPADRGVVVAGPAPSCADGFGWNGSKCVERAAADAPCDPADAGQCVARCEQKQSASCIAAGSLGLQGKLPGVEKKDSSSQLRAGVGYFERACALGDGAGCNWAGYAMSGVSSDTGDRQKEREYYERGCEVGDGASCYNAARSHSPESQAARELVKSADKTMAYLKRGCDLGEFLACDYLGDNYLAGKFAAADGKLALAAFERSVNSGAVQAYLGYVKIARMYRDGKRVGKDPNKALEYFERGCALQAGNACWEGARFALEQKNDSASRSFLERACNAKMRGADACFALGQAYENGQLGLKKDAAKAVESYLFAAHDRKTLARATELVAKGGPGLKADPTRADDLEEKLCDDSSDLHHCARTEARKRKEGKAALGAFYQLRCQSRQDGRACLRWKSLGGTPDPELLSRHVQNAQSGCQREHRVEQCVLWKDLGGRPTKAELSPSP